MQDSKLAIEEMYVVRKIVRPYLCVNGRQKMQFGVWTLVANFDLGACLNSFKFDHDKGKQIMDEGQIFFFTRHGIVSLCMNIE